MALTQTNVGVVLGETGRALGELTHTKDGRREHSTFAYDAAWLGDAGSRFSISPDLPLVAGHQFRKASSKDDSIFHFAFADTEPDGWGCRVIARDHAKRRKAAQVAGHKVPVAELSEMDYLLGVDDVSRVGALRLRDPARDAAGAEHLERVEQHDTAAELFERERRRRVQPRRRPPRGREAGRRRHQKSPSFT